MSGQERHLTTEQLSAFLDQEFTPEELASCSAHLEDCKLCQHILDDLQQTANLLRSLPQLEVPRSFVLPADFNTSGASLQATLNLYSQDSQMDHEIEAQAYGKKQQRVDQSTAIVKSSPNRLPTALRRTLRAVSALAAVIGLFFVLSGFLATPRPNVSMSTMPASDQSFPRVATDPSSPQAAAPHKNSDESLATYNGVEEQQQSPSANRVEERQQTPSAETNSTATQPIPPFLDFSEAGVRLSFGILLAILGGIGIRLFSQRQKRRTHSGRMRS